MTRWLPLARPPACSSRSLASPRLRSETSGANGWRLAQTPYKIQAVDRTASTTPRGAGRVGSPPPKRWRAQEWRALPEISGIWRSFGLGFRHRYRGSGN